MVKIIYYGPFKYDFSTGELSGPFDYMEEMGNDVVDQILQGKDPSFKELSTKYESKERGLLVALHNHYSKNWH